MPSLPEPGEWEAFTAARLALGPNLSRNYPAERYRTVDGDGPRDLMRLRAPHCDGFVMNSENGDRSITGIGGNIGIIASGHIDRAFV